MLRWLCAALATAALVAACGGDDTDNPSPSATSDAPAATATTDPRPTAPAEVTDDERAWVIAVCQLDLKFIQDFDALPGAGVDTSTLTIEQRRARSETFWPASIALNEQYVRDIDQITPPPRVAALHNAIREVSVSSAAESRRSLGEIDAVFASQASLDANNARIQAAETSSTQAVDDLFNADPPVLDIYQNSPECLPAQ